MSISLIHARLTRMAATTFRRIQVKAIGKLIHSGRSTLLTFEFSIEMHKKSIEGYEFPNGSYWAGVREKDIM
jgi:hypothetical protein